MLDTVVEDPDKAVVDNKVNPPLEAAAPAPLINIAADVLVKFNVPLSYCANAKDADVLTVAVPAVIVQTPAPRLVICTVSPAANKAVFTVIVVALALDIDIAVPASAATNV